MPTHNISPLSLTQKLWLHLLINECMQHYKLEKYFSKILLMSMTVIKVSVNSGVLLLVFSKISLLALAMIKVSENSIIVAIPRLESGKIL